MEEITVWRVENNQGLGPYSVRPGVYELSEEVCERLHSHPTPELDFGKIWWDTPTELYVFGFKSIYQLRRWFTSADLEELFKLGYRVVKYRVAKELVIFGTRQVAFSLDSKREEPVEWKFELTPGG